MKFAKQLDENAVPEWKAKYLDYKQGKKKLKAAAGALRKVEKSPLKTAQGSSPFGTSSRDAPVRSFLSRGGSRGREGVLARRHSTLTSVRSRSEVAITPWRRHNDLETGEAAQTAPRRIDERSPLRQPEQTSSDDRPHMQRYGSIIGSPPDNGASTMPHLSQQRTAASLLELPDPALDPAKDKDGQRRNASNADTDIAPVSRHASRESSDTAPQPPQSQLAHIGNAYEVSKSIDQPVPQKARSGLRAMLNPRRVNSSPNDTRPPFMRRLISAAGGTPPGQRHTHESDVALEEYQEVDFRKAQFFAFLEKQLDKIEEFYEWREDEAKDRLKVLVEQLHIMRQHRLEEVEAADHLKRKQQLTNGGHGNDTTNGQSQQANGNHKWPALVSKMDSALGKVSTGKIGLNSKAMRDLGTPSFSGNADNRDYTRRPTQATVSYRTAKRKLKAALIEYYRGLELVKSYSLLNHTAFRKITKKCDKTLPDMPGQDFMTVRINRARFVSSGLIDELLQ